VTFPAGLEMTGDELDLAVEKLIARGRRTTPSTASTGSTVAVLRLDDIPIEGGYAYAIRCPGLGVRSTVAADLVQCLIRYTTDGSTPTTSSPILQGSIVLKAVPGGSTAVSLDLDVEYYPAPGGTEQLSLLLCVIRLGGTGSCSIFADGSGYVIDLRVYNMGPDVGDTGTDL